MKFRITKKDFLIFSIFCFFLLYLCAIAILNFDSFANYGSFYGLLPFKAFNLHYLPLTLGMFFVSLIVIFSSVSSYIFSKEKGTGIGLNFNEKNEKGYSRWAKEKEIAEDKGVECVNPSAETVEAAGVPLFYKKDKVYVDNSQYHNLIVGTTGSGKSESIVKPMVKLLAKNGQSMIITDPKGELYKDTSEELRKRGYNIIILNFRDPQKGNAWNPLTLPYKYYQSGNFDKATELLDDVALNILQDANNKNDPFWEKSASDYFSGLALGLFQDAKEEEVNLNSINLMSTVGEERFGTSHYINEYFRLKGESSSAYVLASGTINSPSDTKGGILSTFRQKIRTFSSRELLSEMLSYSDFDMASIGKEKTAVYMIIHDEKTTYHSLLTIFIKQCYETLVAVANENGGKLPIRTNFILDEFANMPPLKDVGSMVSAARSREIRMTFIIQNFAQLSDVYGKEVAEVIKGNCNNWIYLLSTEIAALEEISKICGEVKSKEKEKTASTPLITVTDLQKFKMGEALLLRSRKYPFRTKLKADFEINWGMETKDGEYPIRKEHSIELFDLKKFVSEEKRKKMMENGADNGMNQMPNPFGGMMNSNPFGNFGQMPSSTPNPFKPNPISDIDIDKVMADIDKRLKELDEEEAREKQQETKTTELPKAKVDLIEEPKEEKHQVNDILEKNDKPKINVDVDSVIVNDNIITDDEFFDDFFQDE
jgi:type IV secretion system protein VirD4